MTAFEILAELRELGATLFADGNNIRYRGPKGALTSELRQDLARNKTEVLGHFSD